MLIRHHSFQYHQTILELLFANSTFFIRWVVIFIIIVTTWNNHTRRFAALYILLETRVLGIKDI